MTVTEFDVSLPDGRTLHAYDRGGAGGLPVLWHHGTPNIGAPPEPLFEAADRLGLRWISYDRPGYGGSTRLPGRTMTSAAADTSAVIDALGLDRIAVVGHSGGASHAVATAALLGDRVLAVVSLAALAPYSAVGLDWFDGMTASGVTSLWAAAAGRTEKERQEASEVDYDPEFTAADLAALAGTWAWLGQVVGPALAGGPGGLIDDDMTYVAPWGCRPQQLTAPVLFLHGGQDRVVPSAHSVWLAQHTPDAELRLSADDGHISVLEQAGAGLEWLRGATGSRSATSPPS